MAVKSLCSIPNCGKPHKSRGYCDIHYRRFLRHGDPMAGRAHVGEIEHFIREIALTFEGKECLIWPFARDNYGYGKLRLNGRSIGAHRYLCTLAHGPHPKDRTQAAHGCGKGTSGCVNPNHLAWKTRKENEDDKLIHGGRARGERCGTSKITEADVREIRLLRGIKPHTEVAKQFGISVPTVSEIQNRRKWAWLPD